MKVRKWYVYLPLLVCGMVWFALDGSEAHTETNESAEVGKSKLDNGRQSFDKMMSVLTHPRCMNCHPSDNVPKQGEDSHPHHFGMARGEDDHGFVATNCNTCHQEENNDFSGVPGAPKWSLAPESMNWQGLSRIEIAGYPR